MTTGYGTYKLSDLAKAVRHEDGKKEVNVLLATHCKRMIMFVSKADFVEKEAKLYPPGSGEAIAGTDYDDVARYAKQAK